MNISNLSNVSLRGNLAQLFVDIQALAGRPVADGFIRLILAEGLEAVVVRKEKKHLVVGFKRDIGQFLPDW